VVIGVIVGFVIRFVQNNDLSWAILNLIAVAVTFIAGAMLQKRTHLGKVSWMDGDYMAALRGFGLALLLAIPAASLNLIGEIYTGDSWVMHWWQALAAFAPSIGEEVWARLFLITLIYALLRPSAPQNAGRAVLWSVLVSSLMHAMAHTGFNPVAIIFGVFFYGVPPALLYIKRDLEHAIGYHFMIDFVRFLAAAIFATV
jgi:membrane protease YdiL (CAAX protease family)